MTQPTPTPSPSDSQDPTIQRIITGQEQQQQQEQKQKQLEEKNKKQKELQTAGWKKLVTSVLDAKLNSDTDYVFNDIYSFNNPKDTTFGTTLKQLKDDQNRITGEVKSLGQASKDFYEKRFNNNKKVILSFIKTWESKNKRSILDVLSSNVPAIENQGFWGDTLPANQVHDIQYLYQIMSDNPDKKQKFIVPKTFKSTIVLPDKGSFTVPPASTTDASIAPDATAPATNGSGTNFPTTTGAWGFSTGTDQNGNIVHYFDGNPQKTINIALIGGNNGKYIVHNPNYDKPQAGTDPAWAANSPQSIDEYMHELTNRLNSTPGAVRKIKELLIRKNIIAPNQVNAIMMDPDSIEKTTYDALQYIVNMTTAHNVTIAKNPNSPLWSTDDFLKNMKPLSNTSTQTTTQHQKITPQDYEISIDKMFQDSLGRGATKEELAHFSKQLQSYANAHPTRDTTTTTTTPGGGPSQVNTNTTSSQSGGVSQAASEAMMRDQALNTKGAKEYTEGAKYFNWFQDAVNNSSLQLGG